jgi:hypothetical protein
VSSLKETRLPRDARPRRPLRTLAVVSSLAALAVGGSSTSASALRADQGGRTPGIGDGGTIVQSVSPAEASASITGRCGPTWRLHASPQVPGSTGEYIADIDASPGSFAFAAGRYWDDQGAFHVMVEQWDGTRWKVARTRFQPPSTQLEGVAAISDTDAWAVGDGARPGTYYRPLALHWDGLSWSRVPSPPVNQNNNYFLYDVDAVASDDVWAVGVSQPGTGQQTNSTFIEHWDGVSWQIVPSPNFGTDANELWSVAAISTADVWAVGRHYPFSLTSTSTLVEHWNGTEWSIVPSPDLQTYDILFGVDGVSATDIWAVGAAGTQGGTIGVPLALHWAGSTWDVVPAPKVPGMQSTGFAGVKMASANDAWAVGSSLAPDLLNHNTAEHWDGNAWSIEPFPEVQGDSNGLGAITLTSSGRWWAAGGHDDPLQPDTGRAMLADLCP